MAGKRLPPRCRFTVTAALALLLPFAVPEQALGAALFATGARQPEDAPDGDLAGDFPAALSAGTRRSRAARVDFAALGAVRDAVGLDEPANLRLNLFHDVELEAVFERSAPTANGYSLSGPIRDVPHGRAVLVVNGRHTVGRIYTPGETYTIRTTGSLQTVERTETQPFQCEVVEPKGAEAAVRKRASLPDGAGPRRNAAAAEASEDGRVVDVLVAYPSFVRRMEGGYEPLLAMIDLDIATANEAYAASGVDLRVELAAAEEVEFDWFLHFPLSRSRNWGGLWREALEHLTRADSGELDAVHALRDRHAADLVVLHLGGVVSQIYENSSFWGTGGIAWRMPDVSGSRLEDLGFSAARSVTGIELAHELGHSMGLHHERVLDRGNEPFPYSHGFSYDYAEPREDGSAGFPSSLGTVMAASSTVRRRGFVLAFSNPELSHPGDPDLKLGVPGDEPSDAADGPADAVRHLNELGEVAANVRARAQASRCSYELSGDEGLLEAEGGTYALRVETGADCAWTASPGEWVASVSPAGGTGSGAVEVTVGANDGWQRPVEVLVSGRLHARRQAGSRPMKPVCQRSSLTWGSMVDLHPDYDPNHPSQGCESFDWTSDLGVDVIASVRSLDIGNNRPGGTPTDNAHRLRPGDFDGMTGLQYLFLQDAVDLPPELFFGLIGLRFLQFEVGYRENTTLRSIAPGAFRGLPGLLKLRILGHRVPAFRAGTFEGMPSLLRLVVSGERGHAPDGHIPATSFEPGAWTGLASLRALEIGAHRIGSLEPGTFPGLGELRRLTLGGNRLRSVARGAFDGLRELRRLELQYNELDAVSAGAFEGLGNLRDLSLWDNRLARLPLGAFDGLPNLERLHLGYNRLAALEPGTFAGLARLKELILHDNRLRDLPPGLFKDSSSLGELSLRWNRLGSLPAGVFEGLDRLNLLYLRDAGVTSLHPDVFRSTPNLEVLDLERNGLRALAPGLFRGLHLRGLHLGGNPGAPVVFRPALVAVPPSELNDAHRWELSVETRPEAPFDITAEVSAAGGTLSYDEFRYFAREGGRSADYFVEPDGDGPVTLRIDRARWQGTEAEVPDEPDPGAGDGSGVQSISFSIDYRYGYSGIRVEPGPPLVLNGLGDRELVLGRDGESIDLAPVFGYVLGADAEHSASSSDESVARVAVEDGALRVVPGAAGTAEVTVTATGGGETLTRRFSVTVRLPSAPLLLPASDPGREGFVRLINHSDRAGPVRITAIDDAGERRGPVTLRLRPHGAVHFNSGDLENGNAAKGIADGIGFGEGDWRLEFESALDIEPLAYVRTRDGFLTGMHALAPFDGERHLVATFNPASNPRQASRLRVANLGREPAEVTVRGIDDAGASPGGAVRFTVAAGAARTLTAAQLESGAAGLDGALGDGEGKWRLEVESAAPIEVMSLLENAGTGHLTNLSAGPVAPDAGTGVHHVGMFPAASGGAQGFVRVANRSPRAGTVRIRAFDDLGRRYDRLDLALDAGATAHFNSDDLELGNAAKGLSGSTGPGEGDWRLELDSGLDIEVLAYVRTVDGFLTAMHGAAAVVEGRHRVVTFNPGSNHRQVSRLRLVNPGAAAALVRVAAVDDRGGAPRRKGALRATVPAYGAVTYTAAELEAGVESGYSRLNDWEFNELGDGTGKWRLNVTSDQTVRVMSLLESPTGHLTNLSSSPSGGN